MWRFICQSVQGAHHRADGSECHDSNLVRYIGDAAEGGLVACVADGAGSSSHSGIGSRMACESIVESAAAHFEQHKTLAKLEASDVLAWCDAARKAIAEDAEMHERQLRDYATTLCAAVITAGQSIFFQIGDGAIVARRNGVFAVVFWPQSGEYINTTNFLTSPNFLDQIQVCAVEGDFADVALLTDGIERLALQFDSQTPHPPFFHPLFATLRAATNVDALTVELGQFLQSDSIQIKSDDDKTLLLGCRIADEIRRVD